MIFSEDRFIVGVNYWPRETAMHWWNRFDASVVRRDFELLHEFSADVVRIFLLWEDFQPEPRRVELRALKHLVQTADIAHDSGIYLLVTFFCGHMSGANWLPGWMIRPGAGPSRFPIVSGGALRSGRCRNIYTEPEIWTAQKLLLRETAGALEGHPAVAAWDLGNEPSNLVLPPSQEHASTWLEGMVEELSSRSPTVPITVGLQQEDLEEDRHLTPQVAAEYCDFLSMHAYSIYAPWADSRMDSTIPAFLGLVTRWLSGKPVLIEEFGMPTEPLNETLSHAEWEHLGKVALAEEEDAAAYYHEVFDTVLEAGLLGALVWCYSDYPALHWRRPPLDRLVHERFFGLFRSDGIPKRGAHALSAANKAAPENRCPWDWVDMDPEDYYKTGAARDHLVRLYRRFKPFLHNRKGLQGIAV